MRSWRRSCPVLVALWIVLLVPVAEAGVTAAIAPDTGRAVPAGAALAARGTPPQLPAPTSWPFPEGFPRTSGSGRLAAGALEWTDFLYDDHGATGLPTNSAMATGARSKGTYTYADPAAHGNGADLFRLGVGLKDALTYWRADWVTLDKPGSVPVVAFGLADPAATSTVAWPAGTGVRSQGLLTTIVASSRGAWLVTPTGQATPVTKVGGNVTMDLTSRTFLVTLPRAALPSLSAIRVNAVSGVADPTGRGFAPVTAANGAQSGQPAVYNVGFRSQAQEPPADSSWMDSAQAAALAAGDIGAFGQAVNWQQLASGASTSEPQPTGYTNRWYVSSLHRGEGFVTGGASGSDGSTTLPGRLLPYAAYVPKAVASGRVLPLTWTLHAVGYLHNMYGPNPHFLAAACEERDSLCLSPSGRSPSNPWYNDAELDFWEVWRDANTHFHLDPDRTVLAGYSMGGLGATRIGLAYPDAFTQIVSIAGGLDCGVYATHGVGVFGANNDCQNNANFTPMLPSGRWTPFLLGYNGADELSPVVNGAQRMTEIRSLGYRYHLEVWTAQEHLLPLVNDTYASIAHAFSKTAREERPDRVSYAWYPTTVHPEQGLEPGQVYWLRSLSARKPTPGHVARVEAESLALARPLNALAETSPTTEQAPGEVPKGVTEGRWQAGPPRRRSNALNLSGAGVGALTVDATAAELRADRRLKIDVTSDGRLTVNVALIGLGPSLPSSCAQVGKTSSGAHIKVSSGHCVVIFAAGSAARPQGPGDAAAVSLPATGGSTRTPATACVLLVCSALVLLRLRAHS